jgi:hypothetical protein
MGIVKFRSKVATEIVMLEPHAKELFVVMGLTFADRGVLEDSELTEALARLHAAIIQEKLSLAKRPALSEDEEAAQPRGMAAPVNLSQRAYPLLRMMELAHQSAEEVHWGY